MLANIIDSILKEARIKKAVDFPTEEAMKKYLHDHPDADPRNHKVVQKPAKSGLKMGPEFKHRVSPGAKKDFEKLDKIMKDNPYLKRAKPDQKKVIENMQVGDLWMFTELLQKLHGDIDKTLQVTVNNVEGDKSQLPDELARYAEKKGWL